MSTTETPTTTATRTASDNPDLANIGVELEYPVARDRIPAPAGVADTSNQLRGEYQREDWLTESFPDDGGYMGSDHTGAEITSGILSIHSDQPEDWYRASIAEAESAGYPFAATGYGRTVFGLHMHVSDIDDSQRSAIANACNNEWARVFFCASIDENSLDPWRHGGVRNPGAPFRGPRSGNRQHYEFRLPEPMLQDHFGLVMDFWRMAEDDVDAAIDFAREIVYDRDERLTSIQQYQQLAGRPEWDREQARREDAQTDPSVAEWFIDLME
jgi:hypothetical protein